MSLSKMRRAAMISALAVALPLGVAACGGDDAGHAGDHPSTTTAAVAPAATSPEAAQAAFLRQMIPHHAMAVEMAQTALERGEHPEIRALARSIVATQNREIAELKALARRRASIARARRA